MARPFEELLGRPIPMEPVKKAMAWGSETWLNGTQEEGPAAVSGAGGTLADVVRESPEVLGPWPRLIFGDELPIFTKFLRTNFPPLVHAGFNRPVNRGVFLDLLDQEQNHLRALFVALVLGDQAAFGVFRAAYERWAVHEALAAWRSEDPGPSEAFASEAAPFLPAPDLFDLQSWTGRVKHNRAKIVGLLNEVDLRREAGNLLLMEAGIPHAIFGLSHQTHPSDHSRDALRALYLRLNALAAHGAERAEMEEAVLRAKLSDLRALNAGPPKNEAWLPVEMEGELVLVEPQQTSNVTFSFADFFTPFTWKGGLAFRKGDPCGGLSEEDLEALTRELVYNPVRVEAIRRVPEPASSPPGCTGAGLYILVEEPTVWPFFTAREVKLAGTRDQPARWIEPLSRGAFSQLVSVQGEARIEGAWGTELLAPDRPAFVPATLEGPYTLVAAEAARILIFSVPAPAVLGGGLS